MHANEVVGVHDRMDKSVEKNGEEDISIVHDISIKPIEEKDGSVVVNMEKRKLTPLLSQNNEGCIPEVPYLGDVKEPEKVAYGRLLHVKVLTGHDSISIAVSQESRLNGHVRTKEDLGHVVNEFDRVGVHGGHKVHDL